MTSRADDHAIGFADPDDFPRARDMLEAAGYNESGITKYVGGNAPSEPIAVEIPQLVLPAQGESDLEILIRLFLLNLPTEIAATDRVLHPVTLDPWIEAGILKRTADRVVPLVRIVPFRGLLLACDIPGGSNGANPTDFVMGIAGSSLTLANSMIRRRSRLTLDLGTGCGVQSFLAAAHSDRVCSVDRNSRAINLAMFGARLNGLQNIDFFADDLFEPVRGKKFDLIVSNPPFVISPEFRAHYRDSGMVGDQFCQQLVRQVPDFLQEGGFCQIVCNWTQKVGQNWQQRLAEWFKDSGCDVWVMRGKTMEPAEYTRFWNRKETGGTEFGKIYRNWMAYFEREQVEAIGVGVISMRRSSDRRSGFRADDAPAKIFGPIGDDIQRAFEAFNFLEMVRNDRELLNARLRIDPHVRLRQEFAPSDEGWQSTGAQLCRTRGLGYSSEVDATMANLLQHCNGTRTVGELLEELANRRNVTSQSLASEYLAVLRPLIARGLLLPSAAN